MPPKRVISSSLLKEKNVLEPHVSNDDEQLLADEYVLINSPEVQPYLRYGIL